MNADKIKELETKIQQKDIIIQTQRTQSDDIMKEVVEITKNEGERIDEIKKLKEKVRI